MIEINNADHGNAIAEHVTGVYNPKVDVVISRSKEGKLLGGVMYQGYTGASMTIHMAGFDPQWINKSMLAVCFHYPFGQLNCGKLFGQVRSTNARALEINRRLGFKEVCRIKDVFPDGDLVVLEMNKSECRWLGLRKGIVDEQEAERSGGS